METNKIYVGTYGKYNNGSIQGEWIELDKHTTEEDFFNLCKEIHQDEEDPEFMFQDFETPEFFKNEISEYGFSSEFWERFDDAKNLDESEYEAFSAYINNGMEWDIDNFRDAYIGHFDGFNVNEEFGQHILEEMGELEQVPTHLRYYIDAESYGRDLLMGDFFECEGYIFRNC